MQKPAIISSFGLLLCLLIAGCFRNETTHLTVSVPAMESEMDARIVTNAALNEVVGCIGSLKHDYEFDLEKQVMVYHEGPQLLSSKYQNLLVASLNAVGMEALVLKTVRNPLPARVFPDGAVLNEWPDRYSVIISIEEMDSITEANIAADAIAYIRNGGDDPRVVPDPGNHQLNISYNNVALSEKNITEAIACSGFSANGVPPKRVSNGWNFFDFQQP